MPAERLSMRKLKEIFRLRWCDGFSPERIATSVGCGRTSVREALTRAAKAGITNWEQVSEIDDAELEQRLYPKAPGHCSPGGAPSIRTMPDWAKIHSERARPGVTLALLWQEYQQDNAEAMKYSRFTELYALWKKKLSLVMRQNHRAGEKCFVDYCDGLFLTDASTGERSRTQLFVGCLGASSYTYAEASLTQSLPDWLMSHVRMFEYFGGVTELTIPDNLRSGVKRACYYDPEINPSYGDLAAHYGTVILPTRVRKPRDKAKVEANVLVAQRWILAVLRDRIFYSLSEMNRAICECLVKLNARVMRHLGKSRVELWEGVDRPVLKALPATRYEFAEWAKTRVNIDYHVEFDNHFYSAPYTLTQARLDLRATPEMIELFHRGKRVASHPRSYIRGRYTTEPAHRPEGHRAHGSWSPERMQSWAETIGPKTRDLVTEIFRLKEHPEQAYRSVLGIIRLAKACGEARVELACAKALVLRSPSYRTVATMLKNRMEAQPIPGRRAQADQSSQGNEVQPDLPFETQTKLARAPHEHVRGKGYYH